ncbi:Phenylacetic acid degradation operon negative regulatory protein paaX [Serratia fonticola]|uniref:Phenylacetic acid degradation operon negative regulatory protein paaX n=1 Tax=Serratia fonticola TaxID=47917 RepID=A0A4U9WMG5_SERFO|nr:Phenylacetic acid degradation operon negative regulatory protein paaX [Serratia fonticola]
MLRLSFYFQTSRGNQLPLPVGEGWGEGQAFVVYANVVSQQRLTQGKIWNIKLDDFIRHALSAQPISGTSLIISLYGDALSHRGGEVWLGSLSALLEALGFGDRFVRTSVFRLQKEGWLDVEKLGRRSYYRVTEQGMRQFRHAESKIYLSEQPQWDGKWELLLLESAEKNRACTAEKRAGLAGLWPDRQQPDGRAHPCANRRHRPAWRAQTLVNR